MLEEKLMLFEIVFQIRVNFTSYGPRDKITETAGIELEQKNDEPGALEVSAF